MKSCCITLWLSSVAIYLSKFGTRQQMNDLICAWSRKLMDVVKLSVQVFNPYGFQFLPNQVYIIMSNHASLYDIPLIFTSLPGSIRMIAKKELMRVPIWGLAMKRADFIFVDRENRTQAMRDLVVAKEKMMTGIVIWMAPEGTRSKNGKLNVFKKGGFMLALETGAIILPVGIRGAEKILPAKTLKFTLNQQVEVHVGKPIDTRNYTVKTRNELIKAVRQNIAEAARLEMA